MKTIEPKRLMTVEILNIFDGLISKKQEVTVYSSYVGENLTGTFHYDTPAIEGESSIFLDSWHISMFTYEDIINLFTDMGLI